MVMINKMILLVIITTSPNLNMRCIGATKENLHIDNYLGQNTDSVQLLVQEWLEKKNAAYFDLKMNNKQVKRSFCYLTGLWIRTKEMYM